MKTITFKCDVCDFTQTIDYTGSDSRSDLINGLVGISRTDNRKGEYEALRNFKELCPECRKQAVKELTEFLIQNKYFL